MQEMTGARESNAGDDFHFLWVVKKALSMFEIKSELEAIYVEGPNTEDAQLSKDDTSLLSIDISEYYGSDGFEEAKSVVFSQLKYSTRQQHVEWTQAKLSTATNKKGDNSIIRRMGDTYKRYYKGYPDSVRKLKLKLVSNRKVSKEFENLICNCKEILEDEDVSMYVQLKSKLSDDEQKKALKELYDTTRLESKCFVGFLKAIDLSDCDQDSRIMIQTEAFLKLYESGIYYIKNNYDKLIEFIREQMQPEVAQNAITKELLAVFFESVPKGLFPVPSYIEQIDNYVEREFESEIVNSLNYGTTKIISISATGGCGKTTLIKNIGSKLPSGSVEIIYDCFGGGNYLDSANKRHSIKNALIQICNELAVESGSSFLVPNHMDKDDYLTAFSQRITQASEYVRNVNEDAIIVIVLDALDNSYIAANMYNDGCFADELLNVSLPSNVRFLVTYRTERRQMLKIPANKTEFVINGFSVEEEQKFISSYFPIITNETIEEIQRLTGGNPRVQDYILSRVSIKSVKEFLGYLRPNGRNLHGIFEEALNKIDNANSSEYSTFKELCQLAVELPRPIPMEVVYRVSGCKKEEIQSICADYLIGIYISDDYMYFRDEDFEYYLKEKNERDEVIFSKIAETLLETEKDDYYSAMHLHIFLHKVGRLRDIINSVYSVNEWSFVISDYEKNEIVDKRIESAFSLKKIVDNEYRVDSYKLLYIKARNNEKRSNMNEIISNNLLLFKWLDLECASKTQSIDNIDFKSLRAINLQMLRCLLQNNVQQASEYYENSRYLIKQILKKPKKERVNAERITPDDIGVIGYYIAITKGISKTKEWLNGWTPLPVKEYYCVAKMLIVTDRKEDAILLMKNTDDIDSYAAVFMALSEYGIDLEDDEFEPLNDMVNSKSKEKEICESDYRYRIVLIEQLIKRNIIDIANKIIKKTNLKYRKKNISLYEFPGELPLSIYLKFYAMKLIISGESYNYEKFCKDNDILLSDEREKVKNKIILDYLMESYLFFARAINSDCEFDFSYKEAREKRRVGSYKFYSDCNESKYLNEYEKNIICLLLKEDKHVVKRNIDELLQDKDISNDYFFELANQLAKFDKLRDIAVHIITCIEKRMVQVPISALEMSTFYIQCAESVKGISKELGRSYIKKAFEVTEDVSEDAYHRINLFEKVSRNSDRNQKKIEVNLSCIIEDYYRKLDDRKHLPTKEIFSCLSNLCPSLAIATACRWEDRDDQYATLGFEESIPYICLNLLGSNNIEYPIVIALSNQSVLESNVYHEIIESILEKTRDVDAFYKKKYIDVIINDNIQITSGLSCNIDVEDLKCWNENINYVRVTKYIDDITQISGTLFKDAINGNYRFENKYIEWSSISEDDIVIGEKSLNVLANKMKYTDIIHLARYIVDNAIYDTQLETAILVTRLLTFGSENWKQKNVYDFFIETISEWASENMTVYAWCNNTEEIENIISEIINERSYAIEKKLPFLIEIFSTQKEGIIKCLLEKAEVYLRKTPWELYLYLGEIVLLGTSIENTNFLEWVCQQELLKVHKKSTDEIEKFELDGDISINESVSWYIIKMLGHIEKKKRWYAIHTLYNLYYMRSYDVLKLVIENVRKNIPELYKDKEYVYYKDSAITSLLIFIDRISIEQPEFMNVYLDQMKEILFRKKTMNVLHRYLLSKILAKYYPENEQIAQASCVVNKEKISYKKTYDKYSNNKEKNYEFRFDTMDIVPKVYYFLGNIFGKTQWEIAKMCDEWISEQGFTNESVSIWNDRFNTREYGICAYGADTSVENLSKYLQFNSMFYVADKLRMHSPVVDDEYPIYTFNEWVSSWLTEFGTIWKSELKTMIPSLEFIFDTQKHIENKKYIISQSLFECPFVYSINSSWIMYLDNRTNYYKSNKRYSVVSGFVQKKDLNMLISKAKMKNYWLQLNDEVEENMIIIQNAIDYFETSSHDNLQERFDPYLREDNCATLKLSDALESFFGEDALTPEDYVDGIGKGFVAETMQWLDSNEDRMYNWYCAGNMLVMSSERLQEYLDANTSMLLVMQFEVNYEDAYDSYGEKAEPARKRVIYVYDNIKHEPIETIEIKIEYY